MLREVPAATRSVYIRVLCSHAIRFGGNDNSTQAEPAALPRAGRRLATLLAWRPSVRVAVAGAALAIVVVLSAVVANLVADQLRQLAVDAALEHAESVVRANLDPALANDALQPGAARDPAIDEQLELLVQGGEMSRVVIWSPDGRAVYSSDPGLRGRMFEVDARPARGTGRRSRCGVR